MMTNMELGMGNCVSCNHFGFCKIYWGTECKRQGGGRIPRLKSMKAQAMWQANNKEQNGSIMTVIQSTKTSEPIRNRVVDW